MILDRLALNRLARQTRSRTTLSRPRRRASQGRARVEKAAARGNERRVFVKDRGTGRRPGGGIADARRISTIPQRLDRHSPLMSDQVGLLGERGIDYSQTLVYK